jgi:hypothetical protein
VTTGQTTPYQISGSEVNVEEIFLVIHFVDSSKAKNTADL